MSGFVLPEQIFSTRFENIVKITDSLVAKGRDGTQARDEARFLEAGIIENAASSEEYQQLCNELLAGAKVSSHQDSDSTNVSEDVEELFNTDGPTMGQYRWATFHRNGQMSTILKAKATNPTSEVKIVALKVTTPSQMQPPHNAEREARLLHEARHETIVPLLESFWYQGNRFVLVFPFMRQDLENLLRSGTLTKRQSQMVIRALFAALTHIHGLGIIHRDVKPSNILLKTMGGPVVLADFGIAWSPVDPQSEPTASKITDVGTTCYRPPELLFGHRSYDTSLDMWAAGCVTAEISRASHEPLFDPGPLGSELGLIKSIFTTLGTPTEEIWPSAAKFPDWGKIRFQQFPAKAWKDLLAGANTNAINLVQQTVCYESTRRLTAIQALQHPAIAEFYT